MNKLCQACFEEKDLPESESYCPECKKVIEERTLITSPIPKDYWDKTGHIFTTLGKGYTVNSKGETFCLGKEEEILKILETKKIPEEATDNEREFYEYIFKLIEGEKNGTEKPRPTRRVKTSCRAPKSAKRNHKRIRPVHNPRDRRKHPPQNKRPKKPSNNHAR